MTETPIDPEDVTEPPQSELEEAAADIVEDSTRPRPIEADPADVADQRTEVKPDPDEVDEEY